MSVTAASASAPVAAMSVTAASASAPVAAMAMAVASVSAPVAAMSVTMSVAVGAAPVAAMAAASAAVAAAAASALATRPLVRVDPHLGESRFERLGDLVGKGLKLLLLVIGQEVEGVGAPLHLLGGGRCLRPGVGQAHHGHTPVLRRLLARDEALLLELGKQLGERLLAHVEQVRELSLGGLGLCPEQSEHAALSAQRVAHAATAMRLRLVVAMDEHSHASHLAVQGDLVVPAAGMLSLLCHVILQVVCVRIGCSCACVRVRASHTCPGWSSMCVRIYGLTGALGSIGCSCACPRIEGSRTRIQIGCPTRAFRAMACLHTNRYLCNWRSGNRSSRSLHMHRYLYIWQEACVP